MSKLLIKDRPAATPGPVAWWVHAHEPSNDDLRVLGQLSDRQRQVVIGIAEGLTAHEIAARLGCSHKTVDSHRLAALQRLGVHGNTGVTRFAIRVGLVGLGSLTEDKRRAAAEPDE